MLNLYYKKGYNNGIDNHIGYELLNKRVLDLKVDCDLS